MAKIAFVLDFEQGHLFPTFGLAASLAERGHQVLYAGIADIEHHVRRQGFDFSVIFEEIYPPGRLAELREQARQIREGNGGPPSTRRTPIVEHLSPMVDGVLDRELIHLQPDLIVISYFLSLEALIMLYKYDLPMVFFTQFFRKPELAPAALAMRQLMDYGSTAFRIAQLAMKRNSSMTRLEHLVTPLAEVPEVLACPPELQLPGYDLGDRVAFMEPSIRTDGAHGAGFPWPHLPAGHQLIYVSLGSQTELYLDRARSAYKAIFDLFRAAATEPWHFLLSLGSRFDPQEFGAVPDNVTISRWVPQMEALKRSALMITHGGLGSVKECLYLGVPMVVLPLERDQPDNAERVQHHRLGRRLDPEACSGTELAAAVREVLADPGVAAAVSRMSTVFRQREEERIGAQVIEEMLVRA